MFKNTIMAKFEITLLGCGSAVPTQRHMTSAQLVNVDDRLCAGRLRRRHVDTSLQIWAQTD